jgi:hypothetical protein
LFIVLRWHQCDAPLIRDEGEYAYAAQLLAHGAAPYEHAFLQKPPMVVYCYALANALFPNLFWAPRLLAYLFAALATVLLGFIARLEFGRGLALPTMWLFTPMVLLPRLDQFAANTEMFMLLPLLGTIALWVCRRHRLMPGAQSTGSLGSETGNRAEVEFCGPARLDKALWFLAGFLGAVALGFKYTAMPMLVVVFAVWSVEEWRAAASGRLLCFGWLCALAGACAATAAVLGFFLARDGGRHLWECTVLFNRAYVASSNFGLYRLWFRLREFWVDWWILFLLPGVLLFRPGRRVWLWLALFLTAWVTTAASHYRQYYVVVTPFWALLAAVAAMRLASLAAARLGWSCVWAGRVFTALAVAAVCLPDLARAVPDREQVASEKFDPINPFPESMLVARRVAGLTSPQDYVYVAGSEPQVLYYAKRFSPTRFVIAYPLMIPTRLAQAYQREAIRDLERHPPAVVVRARWNTSWLKQTGTPPGFLDYLDRLLAENYERVGGYILESRTGRWSEPLPDRELADASLVVFRRKSPAQASR